MEQMLLHWIWTKVGTVSVSPVQCAKRFPATLSSTASVRLSGVSGWWGVPPPPPPVSVIRLASELCSSLDRDGLRTSPPPEPEPEPELLAVLGTETRPVPAAEGQEGGSSLSGLQGVKDQSFISVIDD